MFCFKLLINPICKCNKFLSKFEIFDALFYFAKEHRLCLNLHNETMRYLFEFVFVNNLFSAYFKL